jgi:hypothetical protein
MKLTEAFNAVNDEKHEKDRKESVEHRSWPGKKESCELNLSDVHFHPIIELIKWKIV